MAVQVDPDSDYITPGTLDLEQLFWTGPEIHTSTRSGLVSTLEMSE